MRLPAENSEGRDRAAERKNRRRIVVLSVLLHLLILAVWETTVRLDLASLAPEAAAKAESAPLVFDLQQPDMPREVIATPEDARTTPDPRQADFLSDKNALARNQEPAPGRPVIDDPFSRGDLASHELPRPASPRSEAEPAPAVRPEAEAGEDREREPEGADDRADAERALPRETQPAVPPRAPFQLDLPGVPHRQMEGRAAEDGGLSFNTYDWDFAPYLLALKERIRRNIFPPLAFSRLGMIDGDTMLRFKIYPDGRLADLELLGYSGHRTLMETSRFAVTASAPFPDLPADFPKSYLEVTAKFSYFIKR